jgi:type IV pilus assembly protein PilB
MVRKICQFCKVEVPVTKEVLLKLGVSEKEVGSFKVFEGKGCQECGQTGYSGRSGIFEAMPITPAIEEMILKQASTAALREQAIKEGMLTLRMAGLMKIKQGLTSVEEVLAESSI